MGLKQQEHEEGVAAMAIIAADPPWVQLKFQPQLENRSSGRWVLFGVGHGCLQRVKGGGGRGRKGEKLHDFELLVMGSCESPLGLF